MSILGGHLPALKELYGLIITMYFLSFLEYVENGAMYFWLALSLRVVSAVGESIALPASYPLGKFKALSSYDIYVSLYHY